MAVDPLKQEGVVENQQPSPQQLSTSQRLELDGKTLTSEEHIKILYQESQNNKNSAKEILKQVEKTNKAMEWTQTITYLGFILVLVSLFAIVLDVFFHFTDSASTPSINIYEHSR